MKNSLYILFGLMVMTQASANLCGKDVITDAYRQEAGLMQQEVFAPANPDYRGDKDYNAWVLACNRDRDTNGKALDKVIDPATGGKLGPNLAPVIVKGKYKFYGTHIITVGATTLKYRYRLRRENGLWIVTLPIELDFPDKPLRNRLDIPEELAFSLNLMSRGGTGSLRCDRGQQKYSTKKKKGEFLVDTGYIRSRYGEACRLQRDLRLGDGSSLLSHYYDFWKLAIETAWSRPGFELEVLIVGHDRISDSLMTAFKHDNVIWKNYLTLNPDHRPRFRPGFANIKHMYTGLPGSVIAHEAGHYLGLDDEYREKDRGEKNTWRDCAAQGGDGYIMCSSSFSRDSRTIHRDPGGIATPSAAKGVYAWIITRRYLVAKDEFCKLDTDCAPSEFCAKGTLGMGRNACEKRYLEGEKCSADKQCISPAICKGKPVGRCITESSVALGGACTKDAQCKTGSCNKNGICQCTQNSQCGEGYYCAKGTLGIGKNSCKKALALCEKCSADDQCGNRVCKGKPFGKCIRLGVLQSGVSCCKDAQCNSGKCKKGLCR